MMHENPVRGTLRPRLLPAALAAWLGYLLLDFLMHGVFLASWWRAAEAYLLPTRDLVRLIPLGYASFAIYCGALTWLVARLYGEHVGVIAGLRFGVIAGLVFGVASTLGTYSALPMPTAALVIWPASVVVESAIAGALAAWVLMAARPWRRVGVVLGAVIVLFIVGVVIQNLFFPTPADHRVSYGRGDLGPDDAALVRSLSHGAFNAAAWRSGNVAVRGEMVADLARRHRFEGRPLRRRIASAPTQRLASVPSQVNMGVGRILDRWRAR